MQPAYVQAPAPPPPAAKPKGSSALKIVLVLLVVFAVGAVAVIGGLYYVAHKVKQTVVEKAATYGVDLSSSPSSSDSSEAAARPLPKACDLLSAQEVSQFLGEPIERKEQQSDGACFYYGPAGLSAELAQEQAASTFHRAAAPGSNVPGNELINSVDQLANNLGVPGSQTGTGGEMPLLMLIVANDGKVQMKALNATAAFFGRIVPADNGKGLAMSAKVPGLGDEAIRLQKLGLNVLQGNNLVRIIAGPVPDADAKTIEIARAVLPKI